MIKSDKKPRKWGWLVLITTTSTLLCCALPILLVSLGMGAVVAFLATNVPFFVTLSQYSTWIFVITALILILTGWILYKPMQSCPAEEELGKLCESAHKWNIRLLWVSIAVWCIGAFSTFILPHFT